MMILKSGIILFMLCSVQVSPAQHIDEIRREVDPTFSASKLPFNDNPFYEPIDYTSWETNPHAQDYYDAYNGYNLLYGRLIKLFRDSIRKIEPGPGRDSFQKLQQEWEVRMHAQCNKQWNTAYKGRLVGSSIMLPYLTCISKETKKRLIQLGFDKPFNEKLDHQTVIGGFTFGEDLSTCIDRLIIPKTDTEKDLDKSYEAKEASMVYGQPARVTLWFSKNKLYRLNFKFKSRNNINSQLLEAFGPVSSSSTDQITLMTEYIWKGARITANYLIDNESGGSDLWISQQPNAKSQK